MSGYRTEDLAHEAARMAMVEYRQRDPHLSIIGWAVVDDLDGGFAANLAFVRREGRKRFSVVVKVRCPEPRSADMRDVVAAELSA